MPKAQKKPKLLKNQCSVCLEVKSAVYFPFVGAKTCSECEKSTAEAEAAEAEAIRIKALGPNPERNLTPAVESVTSEDGFTPVTVELDYSSPTIKELAARTLARRRLLYFIKRFQPKYQAGWVHADICKRLERFMERVENKESPRLLLLLPYRHGKSHIASRHCAPWILGHHPDWEIIAASNAQSLAMSFSRYIRDLLRDPSYQVLFPDTKLDPGAQSVENWNTLAGGGYLASGVGTAIIGRGANCLILDDLVKDAEAADSQVQRDAIWEWFSSTAYSRLAPGGGVLFIGTAWNDDDFSGRLIQAMNAGGDQYEVVKYPAVNEHGDEYILPSGEIIQIPPETAKIPGSVPAGAVMTRPQGTALHPERYTIEMLNKIKANYYAAGQQRWWHAGYQQDPSPEEGAFFAKSMFQLAPRFPPAYEMTIYQAWDFAITEKQSADWTVCATLGQDQHDNLYVLDILRFRLEDGIELANQIVTQAMVFKKKGGELPIIAFEDGQIWKAISSSFTRRCTELSCYPSYEVLTSLTDKKTRAQPLRGRMQANKVFFSNIFSWYNTLKDEFLRFPTGKHDDQVDAVALAVRLALTRIAPKPPEPKKTGSWKDKMRTMMLTDITHMAA